MFNISIVHRSLKLIRARESYPGPFRQEPANGQDKEISYLINDVFEGDILKTPQGKGWHFYNQINGDRLDFSNPNMVKLDTDSSFKNILSNKKELYQFIDPNDYYTFYLNFIMAYEEILGLKIDSSNDSIIISVPAYSNRYNYKISYKKLGPIRVQPINVMSLNFRQK
jgi:hypothetical protein